MSLAKTAAEKTASRTGKAIRRVGEALRSGKDTASSRVLMGSVVKNKGFSSAIDNMSRNQRLRAASRIAHPNPSAKQALESHFSRKSLSTARAHANKAKNRAYKGKDLTDMGKAKYGLGRTERGFDFPYSVGKKK